MMQLINCGVLAMELKSKLNFWLLLSTEQESSLFPNRYTEMMYLY